MIGPQTSYLRILEVLREQVANSASGTRLPSEHELALRHDVSRGTARRALDELMREGLAIRVQGKGSFVAALDDQSTVTSRQHTSRTIALVEGNVRQVESGFLHAVEQGCAAAGYRLLLASSGADPHSEMDVLRRLRREGCAGFLIRSYQHPGHCDVLEEFTRDQVPFVLVDRAVPGIEADSVVADHYGGMHTLTRDLLAQGHRRLALLLHRRQPRSASIEARVEAFRQAHEELGVPLDPRLIICTGPVHAPARTLQMDIPAFAAGPNQITESFHSVLDLLQAISPAVTAWVGINDVVAVAALRHAMQRGIRVPEQVSIAGFDGSDVATLGPVCLTTVGQPFAEMGNVAAARLFQRIDNPALPTTHTVLPTRLFLGVTTGPASAVDRRPPTVTVPVALT